jgi:hypothetical protein
MTQKDAVFSVITSVLADAGISFNMGNTDVGAVLTKELRAKVNGSLCQMILNGDVEFSKYSEGSVSMSELRTYVSGLISNWVRKDPRLNGGATTASRTSLDPQLKALKKLQSTQTDPSRRLEIQNFIDKRVAELSV